MPRPDASTLIKLMPKTQWCPGCRERRILTEDRQCYICKGIPLTKKWESHGCSDTPEYNAWKNIKRRTTNPRHREYRNYGARGIRVCNSWFNSFATFFADVGPRPSPKHSIDRINNDGNYEPGNVRWATDQEQSRNRRIKRVLEVNGVKKIMEEWVEIYGINRSTLNYRLDSGWGVTDAVTTPVRPQNG